jgi:hypothetical protein
VVSGIRAVSQPQRWPAIVGDQDINQPVIIEVSC